MTLENPGSHLEQEQKCGGVNPVNVIPILPILIIGSPTAIQTIKTCTDLFLLTVDI